MKLINPGCQKLYIKFHTKYKIFMQNDVKFWVTNIKEHYGIFCSGQLGELVDNVSFWPPSFGAFLIQF